MEPLGSQVLPLYFGQNKDAPRKYRSLQALGHLLHDWPQLLIPCNRDLGLRVNTKSQEKQRG